MSGTVEETLAWEAEQRPRAGAAAIAAGVFSLAGTLLLLIITRGGPDDDDGFISVTEALSKRLAGETPDEPSLQIRQAEYLEDRIAALIGSTLLTTLAVVLAMMVLIYLYRSTQARVPETGKPPLYAAVFGMGLYGVGHLIREIATWLAIADVEPGDQAEALRDVQRETMVLVGGIIEQFGTFAVALAFVLVSLHAMRVGLLTRFMGILGIIVGALTILPVDQPQIVRAFWLVALGVLILRKTGRPPAWETGHAMPWPTQQQIREARLAASGELPDSEPVEGEPEPAPAHKPSQPAKRKRKKRR